MFSLAGEVTLITGAAAGIGEDIARAHAGVGRLYMRLTETPNDRLSRQFPARPRL